ncbi:MAG: hypothetical protein ACLGHQ_10610, partial [Acidimicrobiia bacterium]
MTDRIADLDDVDQHDGRVDPSDGGDTEPVPSGSRWQRYRERRRARVSKWDRPPDPKDWRYFVGTLGKVLIATGILMFGFVAYQLWGTGIETARAQNRLEDAFEQAIAVRADDESETPTTTAAGTDDEPDDPTGTDDPDPDGEPLPELPDPVPSEI